MVSTRGHPKEFPEPSASPSKPPTATRGRRSRWAHTPSNLTLAWLLVSLPLVLWDTGYILLRPHSMPGGWLHKPLWIPYALYARVDYIYGWKAYNENNGFTGAQGLMNFLETLIYLSYIYLLFAYGKRSPAPGRGAPSPSTLGFWGEQRYVGGRLAGVAVLLAFSAAVMTLSKTLLYGLNECFSGFPNIGHNSFLDLIFLWIVPNGAWIVLPSYMVYVTGSEILQGLSIAAGGPSISLDDTSLTKVS